MADPNRSSIERMVFSTVGTVLAGSVLWGAKSLSDLNAKVAAIDERLQSSGADVSRIERRLGDHEARIRELERRE